jgi:hypothetical protein
MRVCRSQFAVTVRAFVASVCTAMTVTAQAPSGTDPAVFTQRIQPLIAQYCLKCHSTEKQKGDLDLEQFTSLAAVRQRPQLWVEVADKLGSGEMPPANATQPDAAARDVLRGWAEAVLTDLAAAHAGDPGPVVLRRLSNAEYTYAVRDLTGVASLDPAREFPVDGAAGEGFTNVGNALVMSPMLVSKYLAAGKAIADHALLLPDGLRFTVGATRRDQTDELLAAIRALYRRYSDANGADIVNVQGIVFATNDGGRLPVLQYLEATLALRDDSPAAEADAIAAMARARALSPKYLTLLWQMFNGGEPSLLLDDLRRRWRGAKAGDGPALVAAITAWQQQLWTFRTVGHIGKVGGPKAWLEPLQPLASRQEIRCQLPASSESDVTVSFVAGDAGDGNAHDEVVWQQPRLQLAGRPDLPLRDVRGLARALTERRQGIVASVGPCLAAVAEAETGEADVAGLAVKHGVAVDVLAAWLSCLGHGAAPALAHFDKAITSNGGSDSVQGWGAPDLPCLLANSSAQLLKIPYTLRPHSIAMHPTPMLRAVAGFCSPVATPMRAIAHVQHVHLGCGNGVEWSLELWRGALCVRLANGVAVDGEVASPPAVDIDLRVGDLVVVAIGPRAGDHACDTTAVDLDLVAADGTAWSLAQDVSPDVLAGNPHADRRGHAGVWHFFSDPDRGAADSAVPAASLLGQWLVSRDPAARAALAQQLQQQFADGKSPLLAFDSPLYRDCVADPAVAAGDDGYGIDAARFGADGSLRVHAPAVITVRLPAALAAGRELVTTGALDPGNGGDGSVQLQVVLGSSAGGALTAGPIVVDDDGAARRRFDAAFAAFRELFPAALCYTKIVPVDEPVTLILFHREDSHLVRLMLDDAEIAQLDRLWQELHFVCQDALTLVDVYDQLWQYATQDADPKVFEPLRDPIRQRAAAFRAELAAAEPRQLDAVLAFAGRAFRRPLTAAEADELRQLYLRLRAEPMPHDAAIRLLLARVLLAPAFLYRGEQPGPGSEPVPVSADELATRLSFLLWSSVPDGELRAAAASGRLLEPAVLVAQARRLLADPRVRRLATEFACTWLHIRDFDEFAEKSERHFPTFRELRPAMYEEAIACFVDLVQNDRPVLELLDSDHTFLNGPLAEHYGIPGVSGPEWRRVDGVRQYGRGGILGLSAVLASQSGASRTSPILRGNWLAEVLLGDRLPRPPKDVPKLPEDEADATLTMRKLVERHRSDARCARCHDRIDPFGFALEGFDAIGRRRQQDLGGRPVDTHATTRDGASFDGIDGLRHYLLTDRRDAFLRQFARKLLGYALGRAVQLSDEPLLADIRAGWPANGYRFSFLLEKILCSRQFLDVRGRDHRDG